MVWLNLLGLINGHQVTQATYVAAVMSVVAVHFPIRNEISRAEESQAAVLTGHAQDRQDRRQYVVV